MTYAEIVSLLSELPHRIPIVRGRRVREIELNVQVDGSGQIVVELDPPGQGFDKLTHTVIHGDEAAAHFTDEATLADYLTGRQTPQWQFADELD